MTAAGGFLESYRPVEVRQEAGRCLYGVRLEQRHCNALGIVHGGALMSIADHTLGYAVLAATGAGRVVTVSLTCEFVAAVAGDVVEGVAEVSRETRALVFVRGELRRGGELVLTASGIWKKLSAR